MTALPGFLRHGNVEAVAEQCHQIRRDGRVLGQRFCHVGQRIDCACLAKIGGIGSEHRCLAGAHAGSEDKAVEGIVVDRTGEGGEECFLHLAAVQLVVEVHAFRDLQFHVVQDDRLLLVFRARDVDIECALADHAEAEVFKQGHAPGERQVVARVEDLQIEQWPVFSSDLVELQRERSAGHAGLDMLQVADCFLRREGFLESLPDFERWGSGAGECCKAIRPASGDFAHGVFKGLLRDLGRFAFPTTDDDMDARYAAFREGGVEG